MPLSIKMEPELRHALAHMIYAIDALAKGEVEEAKFEIESIRGLVFWDSDEGQTADAKEWARREFGEPGTTGAYIPTGLDHKDHDEHMRALLTRDTLANAAPTTEVEDETDAQKDRMGVAGIKALTGHVSSTATPLDNHILAFEVYRAMDAARLTSHPPATEEEPDGKQHEVR